jgi:hypothetical protein
MSRTTDLLQIVKTKKTELLFLALFLRLLKPGGRAAVIVPDGVLFGSSKAHKELRRILIEEQKLDAVVSLPGGVFKRYAGVSTAILLLTKTNSGGTDFVWFYDVDVVARRTERIWLESVPELRECQPASPYSQSALAQDSCSVRTEFDLDPAKKYLTRFFRAPALASRQPSPYARSQPVVTPTRTRRSRLT